MKRVLITGAGGFIGHKLLNYFIEKGYNAVGWDRIAGNGLIEEVDLNDETEIVKQLRNFFPDIVVHCAGSADVGKSVQDPHMDYVGNVTLTHNLLFALHKANLDHVRFVFLSSAGVYGNPVSLPISEEMPLNPLSPYAVHKVMCEELCKYFANNYGMDVRIARIFSAYGIGLKKQIFWDMHNKIKNSGRLEMFGTGNESRDYIHVNDVIQSLVLLSTQETNQIVFNVANGAEITIKKATECFARCSNISLDKISFNGVVREGDPLNWAADISRMYSLGYKKTVDLENGLSEYVDWLNGI